VEVVADHDTLTFIVNGRTVNRATNLTVTSGGTKGPYTSGGIGIQSEGGEILFMAAEEAEEVGSFHGVWWGAVPLETYGRAVYAK